MDINIIATVCAIIASSIVIIKYVEYLLNKHKEAKIEANRHLVQAVCKTMPDPIQSKQRLYVINNDTYPVRKVIVNFFTSETDSEHENPGLTKDIGNLSPNQEYDIRQFNRGETVYKMACISYINHNEKPYKYKEPIRLQSSGI